VSELFASAIDLPEDEVAYLELAARLAHRGWGRVHPNPVVGCVLVRDGRIVAEGYHEVFGGPHAEIVALEHALSAAEGATAYVSLEPCNHQGKTPPCSHALVQAGVRRVVFGSADPGEQSGGGAAALRAAGVDVVGPVWSERRSRAENPAFHYQALGAGPFVALKLAMSLDGRIAAGPEATTRITGPEAEREVHRLRSGFDAVLVGSGTVRIDDPRLTVRLTDPGPVPLRRIVLAAPADLDPDSALFTDAPTIPLDVFCRLDASESAMERLERAGASVHPVAVRGGLLDLDAVFARCDELGMRSILCEGGAAVAASLLRERRVHRLYLFLGLTTLGSAGLAAFPDDAQALRWEDFEPAMVPKAFGRDTLLVLDRQVS
jgi:diaminohydroxyphosphoribosylaminopyrimidine deaminase/5-amino-6-(5-phosphoribosylamino)uracil reductase